MTERKKEIIAIASSLFRKKGYTVVSMRLLAQEVGVKAASLYNHISSKQEILSIIILGVAQRFTDGMARVQAKENTPIDKIKEIILLHIEWRVIAWLITKNCGTATRRACGKSSKRASKAGT